MVNTKESTASYTTQQARGARRTSRRTDAAAGTHEHRWTFLSNYTHVLLCIRRNEDARVRDISEEVGITQRAVQRIISELTEAGAIQKERVGRRNHYSVNTEVHLRHPLEEDCTIGELLDVLGTTLQR